MIITTTAIIPIENINSIVKNISTNDLVYYIKGQDKVITEHFPCLSKMDDRFQELIVLMAKERGR